MKRSRVIFTSIIFILFLIIALLTNSLEATSVEPPMYFGIAELRTTTQMGYAMGNPATGAERIWKIVQYSNTNYNDPTEVSAYCIKADQGFSNETLTDIYDVSYNMKTEKDDIAKQNLILEELINGGQYDNLLALADILYVKGVSTEREREKLLDISGANDVIEKSDFNGIEEYYITDDEIDVVQQAAIWYFTNYQEGGEYDHYNQDSWIWYTSVDNKGVYNNLSSYDPKNISYPSATAGYYREQQMVKLYRYLIDTAKSNAQEGINDEKTILTVYASNENPEAQPIMEVVKLPRVFDLSLRKYITEVNDEPVTNTRVPVVDESTLETGTTATYKHRKDPVEVKANDTITYNITIYNEGEKAGRATEIVDQLPTGLKFVEVVSGNFEASEYNEETNTVYLTRNADNTTNLPAYEEGTLSSETIQIKCKVTETGGETDKILTNLAWIAEEIDEDGTVITSKPGDDRDSEPSTITSKTKDELVTIDNGYIGNSNNSGKDLVNTESYFEGQQDDDDFEKVIIRAVTSVEVSKVWEDNSNQDGIRATEIKVELLKNEQATGQFITLNEGNQWSGKFDNLPTKENGKDITYSVKETTTINGYTTNTNATTDSTGKSYTITNSHTPETINVSVNKVWDDNNNQDSMRAPEIEVALKKGTQTLQTVTLNENNNWSHIFTGLAKYENGKEIEYTIEEVKVPDGYTESIEETTNNNFTITNTHIPEVTSITAKKEWYYFHNREYIKPEYVEFELIKNGKTTGEIKQLTAPTWTATFDNLPVYENGQEIVYTVREINVPDGYKSMGGSIPEGYSLEEQGIQTQALAFVEGTKENNYTITNVYYPFDLSLRKYITKVGDTDITDRMPNIDTNPLIEGYMGNGDETTAHYKHKKDPVTVKTGDKVIYNLTVYNEGLKYGAATKIEDQLPTGLKFERVLSDYYEVESYSETDNLLKLKLKDTNENIISADNGYILAPITSSDGVNYDLDSITIQVECTVTAEAGSENQILTNVAWISEAYNVTDGMTITTQEKADADSEPGTKPNVNKDDLVTADDGYIGNENNNGKDLSNSEEYFEGEQDDDDFEKIVIEAKTEITVTKQWNDNNNQDGLRPTELKIELYKKVGNGAEEFVRDATMTGTENTWAGKFIDLPVYENGEKITYIVREVNENGNLDAYTSNGDATEKNNFTITNTHETELMSITAKKEWNDFNDRDDLRPDSVEFELYKNGKATGTIKKLTAPTWTVTFDNLPVKENGKDIVYTVREVNVPDGYEPIGGSIPEEYSLEEKGIQTQGEICSEGTKENGYTITNIYYPFDLSLRKYITKVGDTDITDRIPNIDINPLIEGYMGNGEETTAHYKHKKNPVTVQTGDKVIYNLTVYNEGLKYGIATKIEDQLPTGLRFERVISDNYEVESYSESDNLLKLKLMDTNTNQAEPAFGDYILEPFYGETLDSVTIQIECTVTAKAGSENQILTNVAWISEAYNAEDNKTITTEKKADTDSEPGTKPNVNKDDLVTTDDGYIGNENNNGKDLSNNEEYFEGEQDDDDFEKIVVEARTQITATKKWEDNNDQDRKRPTQITFQLYKQVGSGTATLVTSQEVTGTGNEWSTTFTNLPVYENGQQIIYTVREANENGNLDDYTSSGEGTANNNYTITNSYTPEMTQIVVTKNWEDNNDQDRKRPGEITLTLYAGEEATENKASVSKEGNTWTYTFSNLPKYADGEEIVYTVRETVPAGYTASDEGIASSANDYTITNSYTPETTQITVTKQWVDNDNQDGFRPSELKIELYKTVGNGAEEFVREATMTGTGNTWAGRFIDLPVYENGEKITYIVREVNENGNLDAYTSSGDATEANQYTITNTHTPELTSVSVNKVWNDNNNQDGVRPPEIQVQLVKEVGGETTELEDKIITLSENNEWKGTFDNLPVNENGEKITYTIKEFTVSGYAVNIIQNSENNFTITNTHTPGTTSVTVNKVWDDKDDQDGLRPDSIQVQLIGTIEDDDGTTVTVVDKNITITADDGWIGTFNDLPVNENGKEIIYTVREITQIDGYTTEITENTETASNENDTQSVANVEEPEITTQTYAAKDMVRAAVATVEPKNFTITNTHIVEEAFDLSLRKFIVAVSEDETIEESDILRNEDGTGYAREPVVDASKLNTLDENGNTITTAIYNHTKEPVLVKKNDIVVYMLRVYNEGEQDGYAAEIKDHLPSYLTFVDGEFNKQYGWKVSADGRTVTTRYLENSVIAKSQTDASGNNTLSYVQVPIMCRVSDSANANENITNIADITEYQDKDKQPVEDRDSKEENVQIPTDEELPGYKDEESENPYVPGQEDDDDFEKVYVQDFDLALRKFISEVDGTSYNRAPNVDLSGLESGTTAIYNHTKDPVLVKRNSVIIYTIRVYNEGDISGYAEEVTDYLPEGLEFLPEHEINIQYEWQVSEDGRVVTTDYLSSAKETTDRQNEIQAFDGQTLDYKEVQIACQVKDNVESNLKLTNLAEITEDSDEDRDSTPDNVEIPGNEELPGYKDDEIDKDYVPGQEDDDDFEKVIVQDFDLALRKFITKVDEDEVTTRVPEVSYNRDEDQITYNHTKEPVEVITGNVVEYTIRVYNEGDIAGYAEEVADDIPDGLRYLPENATNTEYRWVMYDAEGNVTENVEEAVEIRTDYLSKEQGESRLNGEENPNLLQAFDSNAEIRQGNPDYRDIKVAFEVVEPNESDRIIVNSAQITEDSDENGNPVEDIDSIPDEWNEGEDDQDREYIKLTYFDLALRKWVTEAIVIENGQETITQTGHTAEMDPEPVVKVELYRKNINNVTVKFRYSIRITNEGDIAGYATEITDYVPEGLRFVAEDNSGWTDEGNNVISTKLLENTLLQPGESAEVEVVLTWINGEDNMGQKTNIAEISEDYNDKGAPDRDSTPDNQVWGEDDIDDAPVLLSIETGQERIYYVLGFTVLGTLAGGLILIKKFVI